MYSLFGRKLHARTHDQEQGIATIHEIAQLFNHTSAVILMLVSHLRHQYVKYSAPHRRLRSDFPAAK